MNRFLVVLPAVVPHHEGAAIDPYHLERRVAHIEHKMFILVLIAQNPVNQGIDVANVHFAIAVHIVT